MNVEPITDGARWNDTLRQMPTAHVLQTWEWAQFKRATTGWQAQHLSYQEGGSPFAMASILTRKVGPLTVMYVPKGPALDYGDSERVQAVLADLMQRARQQRAVWLKVDPDVVAATGVPGEDEAATDPTGSAVATLLQNTGWRASKDQVQFPNTIQLDLTADEDTLLMAMSGNTRRKVRTAQKKDVTVRPATTADLPTLYDLYRVTGARDAFLIRPPEYYRKAWRDFMEAGLAHALIAEHAGRAIAHVILFHFGQTCWYFYGASANEERQRMPNYLLQWEAMRWAKAQGYRVYDLWGAPTTFDESDPLWGVFQFKRGFRGQVIRHIGAWDYAPNRLTYAAYTQAWPRLRGLLRRANSS